MQYHFTEREAGSDESGKGDFFGGIHISLTLIEPEDYLRLKNENILHRISDSKRLSDSEIYLLAPKLKAILGDHSLSLSIEAERYNEMYHKFNNLNILLSYAHNTLWTRLNESLQKCSSSLPGKCTIDQFCTKEKYIHYLNSIGEPIQDIAYFQTKAESSSLSCAISSIISRFHFLEEISRLSNSLSYSLPLGASTLVLESYRRLSASTSLPSSYYCKTHFKTIVKAYSTP